MEPPPPSEGLPFFGNYTPHFPPPPSASPALAALATGELVPVVIIYTIIVFVGVIGNSGLLVALLSAHGARVRTPLLVSVCVADLLVCACSGPLAVMRASELGGPANSTAIAPFFTGEELPCDTLPCMVLIAAETLPVSASTLSLMMLSVDRYITVQHPRCLSQLQRCPAVVTLLVWAVAALLTTPTMIDLGPNPALQITRVILAYLLPSIAVFACHMGVRSKLCALSLTARAAHGELPLPVPLMRRPTHVIIVAGMANAAQTQAVTYGYEDEEDERAERRKRRSRPSGGPVRGGELRRQRDPRAPAEPSLLAPQPQTSTLQSRRRLANVLVTVAAVFAACWLPHFVCCMHSLLAGGALPAVQYRLLRLTLMLGHAHSAINPAVYWTLNHQTLSRGGCMPCPKPAAARRFLFHLKLQDEQPPSSTNEAALGPFHPRYTRSRPRIERCAPSSHYLY